MLSKAEIFSASRTLGFFPFKFEDLQKNSSESFSEAALTTALNTFFREGTNSLLIIDSIGIYRIEVRNAWFNSSKNMIFADFFSNSTTGG